MTIRDLMEQGIRIQGAFQIKEWSDAEDTYIILSEGSEFEFESSDVEDEILDMEIKYMYPISMGTGMAACIVFEVEE